MASPPPSTETPRRVLIVDDEPALLKLVRRVLSRHAEVVTAEDPRRGRELLAETSFDIVISDFTMPGEDGITFLRGVARTHPRTLRILYTGAEPDHARDNVARGEIHHVVSKGSGAGALVPFVNGSRS